MWRDYKQYLRDTNNHKRILQLYANKLDNLEDMDKFLETYSLTRMNQEELDNLNGLITSSKIESVIKNFQQTNV